LHRIPQGVLRAAVKAKPLRGAARPGRKGLQNSPQGPIDGNQMIPPPPPPIVNDGGREAGALDSQPVIAQNDTNKDTNKDANRRPGFSKRQSSTVLSANLL